MEQEVKSNVLKARTNKQKVTRNKQRAKILASVWAYYWKCLENKNVKSKIKKSFVLPQFCHRINYGKVSEDFLQKHT